MNAKPKPVFGTHSWGSLQGGHVRHGESHYRLVLFPPGCSSRERLLLRIWLSWPVAGAAAVVVMLMLNDTVGTAVAALGAAAVYAAGFLWLRHRLARHRPQVCVLHAEYLDGVGTRSDQRRCEQLLAYATALTAAESAALRGELSPVDFEHLWGLVYSDARAVDDL
jgi:Family of unknown function (DUF6611)